MDILQYRKNQIKIDSKNLKPTVRHEKDSVIIQRYIVACGIDDQFSLKKGIMNENII